MASFDADEINVEGLEKLAKALKKKPPVGRLGVLHGTNTRKTGGKGKNQAGNATIAAAHEYGTRWLPQRSFLRVPLIEFLSSYMEKSGLFTDKETKEVLKSGSLLPWLKVVATIAERLVKESFATSGFGKWVPWKNPRYQNNTGQLLMDTRQLRDAITSEVKESQ